MGRPVDPAASLRFGLRRFGSVLWVSLLAGLGIVVGLLLLSCPAIYLAVAWSVAVPVLLGENLRGRGGAEALARARARPLVVVCGRARPGRHPRGRRSRSRSRS